jgi:Adenylate and Guanylate cyclase catalytic domain
MESTGREHCIHASQETADILAALGKGFWVHPREDKIHAKGKGELQTYWIKPMGLGHSTVDRSTNDGSESNYGDPNNNASARGAKRTGASNEDTPL